MANLTVADQGKVREAVLGRIDDASALIQRLMPKGLQFGRVRSQMERYLRQTPKLLECTPASLFWSFVQAAELGLSVGDFFGEGYVLPFKRKDYVLARFIPGYRGLEKLAYQSGYVTLINAWVIYTDDEFDIDFGRDQQVIYRPALSGDAKVQHGVVCSYTQIRFKYGAVKHDVLPLWRLEQIRAMSPGASEPEHPWNKHTDQMYRKTGIRQGLKDVPKSNEIDRALSLEERAEVGDDADLPEIAGLDEPVSTQQGRASASRSRVKAQAQAAQAGVPGHVIDTRGERVDGPAVPPPPAPPPSAQPGAPPSPPARPAARQPAAKNASESKPSQPQTTGQQPLPEISRQAQETPAQSQASGAQVRPSEQAEQEGEPPPPDPGDVFS